MYPSYLQHYCLVWVLRSQEGPTNPFVSAPGQYQHNKGAGLLRQPGSERNQLIVHDRVCGGATHAHGVSPASLQSPQLFNTTSDTHSPPFTLTYHLQTCRHRGHRAGRPSILRQTRRRFRNERCRRRPHNRRICRTAGRRAEGANHQVEEVGNEARRPPTVLATRRRWLPQALQR